MEVCEAIPKKLGPSYLKVPSSEQEWIQIAKQFEEKWNFLTAWEPSTGNISPSNLLQIRDLIILTINTRAKPRPSLVIGQESERDLLEDTTL